MRKFWTASVAAMAFTLMAAPASAQVAASPSTQQAWAGSGELTDSDSTGAENHRYDDHILQLEAGSRYRISVDSSAFDPVARLYRQGSTNAVAENDDGDGLNPRITYTPTESGAYTLRVLAFSAEGRGAYTAGVAPLPPLAPGAAVPWSARGRIDNDDSSTGADGYRYDEHMLRLEAGRRYILRVEASDFDPIARLYAAGEDTVLAENDDGGDGLNSRISFVPETTGDYALRVAPLANDGRGSYRASAEVAPPLPAPLTMFQRMSATVWRDYEGALTNGDGDGQDGTKVDDYLVRFEAGQERFIALEAADFDAVVQVLRVDGRERGEPLASNDDGGNSLNSLLRFRAETEGDYIVRVTSLGAGGRGTYRLRVSER
ncbi:MAG TPA: PPC domain-containing protein [Allosphingosinicella sp.]|nr:PPC domain-containing protein [Allosphingosinicella sp.]